MRGRTLGVLATIARSVAVFVAFVVGAAAIGALVGGLIWGQWFVGAGLAGCIAALLALPTGWSGAHHSGYSPLFFDDRSDGGGEGDSGGGGGGW